MRPIELNGTRAPSPTKTSDLWLRLFTAALYDAFDVREMLKYAGVEPAPHEGRVHVLILGIAAVAALARCVLPQGGGSSAQTT